MDNSSSERLARMLRAWIEQAPAGAQLPATRELVAEHGVSPVTVQRALRLLVRDGLVETRPGVGTFVRRAPLSRAHDHRWQTAALGAPDGRLPRAAEALRPTPGEAIALHQGYPEAGLLPQRLLRAAFGRLTRSGTVLDRPPPAGRPDLQAWFADDLAAAMLPHLSPPMPQDVVIVPGSQSGLVSAFRALVGAGRALVVESPTYWGALLAAALVGVRLVPIPSGPAGPSPDDLDQALSRSGARTFYAQPNFANPTGVQWSRERSEQIMAVVRHRGAFLIEDDWAHDFGISSTPTPLAASDEDGHVIQIRSLTKSLSPSVRVAGLVARGPARDRLLADTQAQGLYVSGVLQALALEVVTAPGWPAHLRSLRRLLAARRDLLVASVREHVPRARLELIPAGGLNLWLRLDDDVDLPHLVRACADGGLIVASGDAWFPAEADGRYLRLNYSGPDPGSFGRAAQILGRVLESGVSTPSGA